MKLFLYFVIVFVISVASFATAEPNEPEPMVEDVFIEAAPMETSEGPHGGARHKFMFISAEMEHGKVIKGAPYSAEAITERTQTLGDGNRIVHKNAAKVFRDTEGRTRREQQLDAIGNWEASEDPPRRIFIQDPVGKIHYVLEPENQIARKIKMDGLKMKRAAKPGDEEMEAFEMHAPHPMGPGHFTKEVMIRKSLSDKDAKKESLGKQTIEGLVVEGTRTTITIPAGEMGNELPIQIVSERWYSPDLQTNVLTRHNDPRFGETVYQLTRIGRGEQDRSLFEVPQGYKVETGPPGHKIIKREVLKD
ncbi:hypothetical protein L0222_06070 [bacterium]|nr:hypothetical protein [bacterium]MCI0602811.1 hypothetical protein [bacterium]